MRALVVDDSMAALELGRRSLETALEELEIDLPIAVAHNGIEALRELACADIALLICDLHMPDIHGLDVLRFWRELAMARSVAFIATTEVSALDRDRAMALGASSFLAKPIGSSMLASVIKETILGAP